MNIALRLQEKGRQEGIEIGREEIRQQAYQQQLTTARRLLESGIDLELVINSTGLSREEINSESN